MPRWEWRIFGADLGSAERSLASRASEREGDSVDVYVVSPAGRGAVKLRAGLMDVKRPLRVDDAGLEQWTPVLKATFPLGDEDTKVVLRELAVDAPAGAGTLDELLAAVPALRAIEVRKHRRHFTVGGCMVELTDVHTEYGSARSIAVEGEDPALVVATVREHGLDAWPNTNYPRYLRGLAGLGAGRYAVIDVGTNSVKFHVGERDAAGAWQAVADRAAVTRLGEGLDGAGELQPAPIERTVEAIAGMAEEAGALGALAIAAAGTAGMRIASNSAVLVAAVRERCGVTVEVISGADEARLAYLAATAGLDVGDGSIAAFDSGGGSSQFTFGRAGRIDERFSVDVGAVRFTERFGLDGAVSEDVVAAARAAIAGDLERLDGRPVPDAVVAMGGGITNVAAVKHGLRTYDPDVVQGTVLDRAEIDRQIELYRTRSADERRSIVGLQPQRAEVILAGVCIVRTILDKLGAPALTVSDRGLRHGLLIERFG